MASFSSPAILLRRIDHGDYDLIVTFLTLSHGKSSAIAKSAKKSTKRFAGTLELFSKLDIVCSTGRRGGLPILQEAILQRPVSGIRGNLQKTAYASYWAQLVQEWTEEGDRLPPLFHLLDFSLSELEHDRTPAKSLSILFQMRFLSQSGLLPDLNDCEYCRRPLDAIDSKTIGFDIQRGRLVCRSCSPGKGKRVMLSKGTAKQLRWIQTGELDKAVRIRFTEQAMAEGAALLESFVPFHLGREPRSLKFLRSLNL